MICLKNIYVSGLSDLEKSHLSNWLLVLHNILQLPHIWIPIFFFFLNLTARGPYMLVFYVIIYIVFWYLIRGIIL